ncbi:MAG: hypothetical protein F6K54_29145 [Okeania sp. SIO3B5]|uniref:hypothetical protein n=1 Tax=Okeania sp. SIO3B5 TaxID=2607811 RepID=UPI00140053D9|nr:hypothetical protein [Okeania sp. SIO3B5]NEO56785.1 hypothetical protein [Okeania sp. SIO3B5]
MENKSIIQWLGLPEAFGYFILVVSFILCIAPYFPGYDFGQFKVPKFSTSLNRKLKFLGPIFLILAILINRSPVPLLQHYLFKDEKSYYEHCAYSYPVAYNNIDEFKKVLREGAKIKAVEELFSDNKLKDIIGEDNATTKREELIPILKESVVLEEEKYENSPSDFGKSCIFFKATQKLGDKITEFIEIEEYCGSALPKIQEEAIYKQISPQLWSELKKYNNPKLRQLVNENNFKSFVEWETKDYFKGEERCRLIKFRILPIRLQVFLTEDEFNNIPEVKGVDENNKKAEFQFTVLSDKYNWAFESDETTKLEGKDASIRNLLFREDMLSGFIKASELISAGTASCEEKEPGEENKRAYRRAKKLDGWLNEALEKHDNLTTKNLAIKKRYTLNLGKYKEKEEECSLDKEETAYQRKVIIISIISKDTEVNLCQALRNAMQNRSQDLSFNIKNYESFELRESNSDVNICTP